MEETVIKLATSQKNLANIQKRLSQNTKLMAQENTQTFIFDLRDYVDGLAIVTDYVSAEETQKFAVEDIATLLGEQNRLIHHLVEEIQKMIAGTVSVNFFKQEEGELRRTLGSLQGLIELNGFILQDNREFQRTIQDKKISVSDSVTERETKEGNKPGFLKRLFGKNKK